MPLRPVVSDAASQGRLTGCDASYLLASECRSRGLPSWHVSVCICCHGDAAAARYIAVYCGSMEAASADSMRAVHLRVSRMGHWRLPL